MRQVIERFLKHLQAERNATAATLESYRYDLSKFDGYLVKRLGTRFLPGDVSHEHIRNYLMWLADVGHKRPNGAASRARALAAVRSFFRYMPTPRKRNTGCTLGDLLNSVSGFCREKRWPII